jgi:ammonia channel protein AmtB
MMYTCVMHHCMGGVVTKWLERLQKCNIACICSARVSGRVALRGICGRVRVANMCVMHVVSGEICTVLHAGCDGEVSCMCV